MARTKKWEELTFTDDYMFKTVLTKYPRICTKLLETILEIKIKALTYLSKEEDVKPQYASRGIRLDVYVEDANQTVYTIDMQVRNDGDEALAKRTRYYQSAMDMDALKSGVKYKGLKQSFVIFLCPFQFMDGKRHMYTFRYFCAEDKEILFPDGSTKIIIASKGELDDVSYELKCLLDYMNTRKVAGNLVSDIATAVGNVKAMEEEAVKYMTWQDIIDEERDEAREEGRLEGRAEGRAEGRLEGHAEGRAEGRVEGRLEGYAEGRELINSLHVWLKENGRVDDLLQSISDRAFQEELLAEYQAAKAQGK